MEFFFNKLKIEHINVWNKKSIVIKERGRRVQYTVRCVIRRNGPIMIDHGKYQLRMDPPYSQGDISKWRVVCR